MEVAMATEKRKNWKVWWNLCRPHTLTASFVPVFLGTAFALESSGIRQIHIPLFIAMLIASLVIQAATNMFNEYFDFTRGLDNEESIGIGGAIVRDGIQAKHVLYLAWTLFGLAVLLGVYISMNSSWWVGLTGTICMLVAYLYTGGPFPIAYTPFGELTSGFFMGFVIILIAFFIQIGEITSEAVFITLPTSFLIGAINLANNIRDRVNDKDNGRKTIAVLAGKDKAVKILAAMFVIAYVWTACLIITSTVSIWALCAFFSIPKAIQAVKGFIGKSLPIEMMPAMKFTAQTNTLFGFLLSSGLFIGYIISVL